MEEPQSLKSNEMAEVTFAPQQPLVCDTFTNVATELPPNDAHGAVVRLAGRQHKYAHAQAAALRHLRSLEPLKRIIPYAAVCGRSRVPYDVRGV